MFKTKEKLIEEDEEQFDRDRSCSGYAMGVKDAFSSIAERVKFYERYLNESWRFGEEEPELYDEWMKSKENDLKIWLFHFCFDELTEKPVLKEPKCIICGTSINIHDEAYDGKCSKCRKVK